MIKKAPILLRTFTGGFGYSYWSLIEVWYLIFLWHLGSWFFPSVPVLTFLQALQKLFCFLPYFGVMQFILHFIHEITAAL